MQLERKHDIRAQLPQLDREFVGRRIGRDLPHAEGREVDEVEELLEMTQLRGTRQGQRLGVELDRVRGARPVVVEPASRLARGEDEVHQRIARRGEAERRGRNGFTDEIARPPTLRVVAAGERTIGIAEHDGERVHALPAACARLDPAAFEAIAVDLALDARLVQREIARDRVAALLERDATAAVGPVGVPDAGPHAAIACERRRGAEQVQQQDESERGDSTHGVRPRRAGFARDAAKPSGAMYRRKRWRRLGP